jgi:CO dehydrogenase maturation factor
LKKLAYVGSKVEGDSDIEFLLNAVPKDNYLGSISLSPELRRADMDGRSPFSVGGTARDEINEIRTNLERYLAQDSEAKPACAT